MWFDRYSGNTAEFAIFTANSSHDIKYAIYLHETGRLYRFIPHGKYIEIWIKVSRETTHLRSDTEYSPCPDKNGYLVSLNSYFIDPLWKCPEKYEFVSSDSDDTADCEYEYFVSDSDPDPQPSAEEVEKQLEKNNSENHSDVEEETATNLYYSFKKTGYYT